MIRRRDGDARSGLVFVCVRVPRPPRPSHPTHRSACRWLDEWSGPKEVKEHLACRLEARHQTEREAHVLRLAALHQQRMVLAMAHETGEPTDAVSGGSGAGLSPSKLPTLLPPVWMISSPT